MSTSSSNFKKFHKRERVKIIGLNHTRKSYGLCFDMRRMVGKVFEVTNEPISSKDIVVLNNYHWDSRDLVPFDTQKIRSRFMVSKVENIEFDTETLDC